MRQQPAFGQLCDVCGIKLRRVKRLKGLEEFKQSMCRFH